MKVSSFSMATMGMEKGEFEVPSNRLPSRLITWFNDAYVKTQCLAHSQFSLSLTITVLGMYLLCSPTHMRADGLCVIIKLGTKAFWARYNGVWFRNKFDRRKWAVKEEKWINYRLLTIKERRIIVLSQGAKLHNEIQLGKSTFTVTLLCCHSNSSCLKERLVDRCSKIASYCECKKTQTKLVATLCILY